MDNNKGAIDPEYVLQVVKDNIDNMVDIDEIRQALDPDNNSITRRLLEEGLDEESSATLSMFVTTMVILTFLCK